MLAQKETERERLGFTVTSRTRKDNIERDGEEDSLVFGGVKVGQLRLREISVGSVKEKESLKVITIGPSRQRGGGEFNSKAQNCLCLATKKPTRHSDYALGLGATLLNLTQGFLRDSGWGVN